MFRPARETKLAHTHKHPVDEKGRAEKQRKEGGKGGAREHRVRRERVCERDGPRLDRGRGFRAFCCTVPLFGSVRMKSAVSAEPGDQMRSGKERWIEHRSRILAI